jgi:hypothetical protein
MNEHADDVLLDINSTFVFNDLFGTTADIRIDNGKIKILNSKNQPYFIHFPGLMIFNSFPMQVDIGKTPENYITVTRTTLGDEAIFNLPINNTFYNFYLIIIYSIIILLIIILCSFLIFYIIRLKQCRNKK